MLFPRFRTTPAIPFNVSARPDFASADKTYANAPIPGNSQRKRWTSSKAAIHIPWTFMSEALPNNSQRSKLFCQAIPLTEAESSGQTTDMNVHPT